MSGRGRTGGNAAAPVVISGQPFVGQTLTATFSPGWVNAGGQWQRAGANIAGATALTYVLTGADVPGPVTFKPTNLPFTPLALTIGLAVPVNSGVPTISGAAQVGQTLTGVHGAWSGSPTAYSYQWASDGSAIPGATAQTYVPVVGDIGHALTFAELASNATGPALAAAISAATAAVVAASVLPNNAVLLGSGAVQLGAGYVTV